MARNESKWNPKRAVASGCLVPVAKCLVSCVDEDQRPFDPSADSGATRSRGVARSSMTGADLERPVPMSRLEAFMDGGKELPSTESLMHYSKVDGVALSLPAATQSRGFTQLDGAILVDLYSTQEEPMKGIGYSNAFYTNWWHRHDSKEMIYKKILDELRPSILRLRNSYHMIEGKNDVSKEVPYADVMNTDKEFIEKAREMMQGKFEILLSGWTPPAYLKESEALYAGSPESKLKKENGKFVYEKFAQFWLDSLKAYQKLGIEPDYLSVQNEPDFNPAGHHGSIFECAGKELPNYFTAARKVHDKLSKFQGKAPKMIGPEGYQVNSSRKNKPVPNKWLKKVSQDSDVFSAYAFHLYNSGTWCDSWSFTSELENLKKEVDKKGYTKELYMTEYAKLGWHEYTDPLRLGIIIHNTLTITDCKMYLHWDGCWGYGTEGNQGSLIRVEEKPGKEGWKLTNGFEVQQSFYWFKHFSRFIRPGCRRVTCNVQIARGGYNKDRDVLVSAWTKEDGYLAIIMINTTDVAKEMDLTITQNWFSTQNTKVYTSTLSQEFKLNESWRSRDGQNIIKLEPESITTMLTYNGILDSNSEIPF